MLAIILMIICRLVGCLMCAWLVKEAILMFKEQQYFAFGIVLIAFMNIANDWFLG